MNDTQVGSNKLNRPSGLSMVTALLLMIGVINGFSSMGEIDNMIGILNLFIAVVLVISAFFLSRMKAWAYWPCLALTGFMLLNLAYAIFGIINLLGVSVGAIASIFPAIMFLLLLSCFVYLLKVKAQILK